MNLIKFDDTFHVSFALLFFFAISAHAAGGQTSKCKKLYGHVDQVPAAICITLDSKSNEVKGSYSYFKYQKKISLIGSFDPKTSKIQMTESILQNRKKVETGKFVGTWDRIKNELSGSWNPESNDTDFQFWDLAVRPLKIKRHTEIFQYCTKDGVATEVTLNWGDIASAPIEDLKVSINKMSSEYVNVESEREDAKKAKFAPYPKEGVSCPRAPKAMSNDDDDSELTNDVCYSKKSYGVYYINSFFLALESFESGFCGGAHPFEGGEMDFIDLRTGQRIEASDFFTEKGLAQIRQNILKDLGPENPCEIDIDAIWGFDPIKIDLITGTYSFCSGRNGYSGQSAMVGVVPKGLNRNYYDRSGKLFDVD